MSLELGRVGAPGGPRRVSDSVRGVAMEERWRKGLGQLAQCSLGEKHGNLGVPLSSGEGPGRIWHLTVRARQ